MQHRHPVRVWRGGDPNTSKSGSDYEAFLEKRHTNIDPDSIFDVTIEVLYNRHTITAAAVVFVGLLYFLINAEDRGAVENTKTAVSAAVYFVIVLGLLVFPTGPFIRPHPLLWRLAFSVSVVYEIALIFLLFQNKDDARQGLKMLYPDLGVPLVEKDYTSRCGELTYFFELLFDSYFLSHFLGWLGKTLVLRDRVICWTISVTWELVELAMIHMLPNFAECWWDSWILDVMMANALGIWVGRVLCDYLEERPHVWRGIHHISNHSYWSYMERGILQLTPASWTKVRWNKLISVKRFFAVQLVVLAFHMHELSAFLLKHVLWIHPTNPLNVYRLLLWILTAGPAWRQVYNYMTDARCKRMGNHTWLCMVMLGTEYLVAIKFGQGEFSQAMPPNVLMGFAVFGVVYLLVVAYCVQLIRREEKSRREGETSEYMEVWS